MKLKRACAAVASYTEARHTVAEETTTGDILQEEFKIARGKKADEQRMAIVKSWSIMERLAWMTWNYALDPWDHLEFQQTAGRLGELDFMVTTYEQVIAYLDTMNSAVPIRYQLALAQWHVRRDLAATRNVLDDLLDSTSSSELFERIGGDPGFVVTQAIGLMIDILYEQFRLNTDREKKLRLYQETKALMQRRLVLSVSDTTVAFSHYHMSLARMARKLGPMFDFQDFLELAFKKSYEALIDDVDWNDKDNLHDLARVLSYLPGLTREARIAFSAQFSNLHTAINYNADGSGPYRFFNDCASESESESNTSENSNHDDPSNDQVVCDGECDETFNKWTGKKLYLCAICYDCILCENCYRNRPARNPVIMGKSGWTFCGVNHKYIEGPVEGWRGIDKNGVMRIEGEESISFREWLDELAEEKWKSAWDKFWLAEE